jgi:WD40 repeat protein
VAFSSDSKLVASGSGDGTVKLWDTATGALQQTLKGHSGLVYAVAFSSDDKLVASGSGDGTVKLLDMATGALNEEELPTLLELLGGNAGEDSAGEDSNGEVVSH